MDCQRGNLHTTDPPPEKCYSHVLSIIQVDKDIQWTVYMCTEPPDTIGPLQIWPALTTSSSCVYFFLFLILLFCSVLLLVIHSAHFFCMYLCCVFVYVPDWIGGNCSNEITFILCVTCTNARGQPHPYIFEILKVKNEMTQCFNTQKTSAA